MDSENNLQKETILPETDRPAKYLREKTIEHLKIHYTLDHLEFDDFENRLEVANTTDSKRTMMALMDDLPELKEDDIQKSKGQLTGFNINQGVVDAERAVTNIFSGSKIKGVWNPPKSIKTVNVFGGTVIDFREANFSPTGTEISVLCVFGGVEIIVPEGVQVVSNSVALFGGVDNKTSGKEHRNGPVITINGFMAFGGVDIKVKSIKKSKKRRC